MARRPHRNNAAPSVAGMFLRFVGAHWRSLAITGLILFAYFDQALLIEMLGLTLGAVMVAVQPFIGPLLTLVIMAFGTRIIWRGCFPKKKKGNNDKH